jgi:Protein of unknown function (DUF2489)
MTEHLQKQREIYIQKLVSNARAIISNQIGIPLGSIKMEKIMFWINHIETITEIDLRIFSAYNSETIQFPVGTERLRCNKEYLKEIDKELDKLTLQYKDRIFDKCFEIIGTFANKA